MAEIKQSKRRERIGWYFYDWANSAFVTTVITVFIGPYLTEIAKNAADLNGNIQILGFPVYYASYYGYVISLSVLLQVFILPVLGAISDYTNYRKLMLGVFAYLGATATMLLYFLEGSNYLFGGALLIAANICFGASVVLNNSYLNLLAEPDKRDSVSSTGWAIGYIGGGALLALNLALFSNAESFGISTGNAVRISLCSSGLWWAVFTVIPMLTLRKGESSRTVAKGKSIIFASFKELSDTIKQAKKYPMTLMFLLAYIFFNDGVQSVIVIASQFGYEELGLEISTLTQVVLMVQFVAFGGALLFNYLTKYYSTKNVILFCLVIWIGLVVYSYGWLSGEFEFFILGAVIALVMGGTQALSRSLYSKLIPKGKEAEYFSIYEISERGTSWLGPLCFSIALDLTRSYRIALLSLVVFFVLGFVLLLKTNISKAIKAVEEN